MCFFDRYRYPCGHMYWGTERWPYEAQQEAGDDKQASCQVRRVRKYIRFTADSRCYKCKETYSPWVTRQYGEMNHRIYFVRPQFVRKLLTTDLPLDPPAEICYFQNCLLDSRHSLPHVVDYTICPTDYCYLEEGHGCPHQGSLLSTSRGSTVRTTEESRLSEQAKLIRFTSMVLQAMASHFQAATVSESLVNEASPSIASVFGSMDFSAFEKPRTPSVMPRKGHFKNAIANSKYAAPQDSPYRQLDLQRQEIRLFELFPRVAGKEIEGMFHHIDLPQSPPPYTALSYTWGDPSKARSIMLRDRGRRKVRSNLYEFLHQQSQIIDEPKLFWIDALCIDQDNVHERNHQVNLMKKIYVNATNVFVWLGPQSDTSDVAMDFVRKQSSRRIRTRGPGFHNIWTEEQGSALRDLCERPYWRRMWVIQEVLYAQAITVWCGSKSFDWEDVESLYLKFKTLEDTHWIAHHTFVIDVAQSSAAVMIWQRAHWRHPQTLTPRLRTLIEIFRQWQCADVRDKVFALTSMASDDTTIFPDYSMSARDVYFAICNAHPHEGRSFEHMLSQLLGLSERELGYKSGRQL